MIDLDTDDTFCGGMYLHAENRTCKGVPAMAYRLRRHLQMVSIIFNGVPDNLQAVIWLDAISESPESVVEFHAFEWSCEGH